MNDIKPCPHCGGGVSFQDMGDHRITIHCKKCEITLGKTWGVNGTKDELILRWNTRPIEDALQSEVTRLRVFLEEIEQLANRIIYKSDGIYPMNVNDILDNAESALNGGK